MASILSIFGFGSKKSPKKSPKNKGSGSSHKSQHIVVWSMDTCPHCKNLKKFLNKKGLKYEEKLLNNPENIRQFKKKLPGEKGVPQVFVNGKHIGSYDKTVKFFS